MFISAIVMLMVYFVNASILTFPFVPKRGGAIKRTLGWLHHHVSWVPNIWGVTSSRVAVVRGFVVVVVDLKNVNVINMGTPCPVSI